jgi:integrase
MIDPTDVPGLSSYRDRHGKRRWRFRIDGKQVTLPGEPGIPEFEARLAALQGRAKSTAEVVAMPGAAAPRTLRAAWRIYASAGNSAWTKLRPVTKAQYISVAERFLDQRIADASSPKFGDVLVSQIARRHVKAILSRHAETPHAAGRILKCLRRIVAVALDEEWIAVDPTYGVEWSPAYEGWRAWTDAEREAFEARWAIGTTPRLCYALALYTGSRRGDVVRMKWTDLVDAEGATWLRVVQQKGGKELWLPILPELGAALDAAPRVAPEILVTQYGARFSDKALGMRMMDWTRAAGIGPGATIHGLRKTLGKLLAEGEATTRQIMEILGHTAIQHAELYSREAEQRRLARQGMEKIQGRKLTLIRGGK